MGKDKNISTDKAYEVGQRGGTVDTNGMSSQQKQAIDTAVNQGKASNTTKK